MSSGGQQTSTQTTGTPAWLQPYATSYLDRANAIGNTPYQQSPTQVATPNNLQTAGWQAIANRATQGSPVMSAANSQLTNTINGGFLDGNPYMDRMVDKAQGDVIRNYNLVSKPQMEASMVRSGSYGNSGLMEMQGEQQRQLQESLGNISTQMRGQNYAQERQNQQSAIGMAPGFAQQDYNDAQQLLNAGSQMAGSENQQNQQNYQWWREAMGYPSQQLDVYGNALRSILGTNSQTSQTSPGTSTGASVLGGALTAAQIYQMLNGD